MSIGGGSIRRGRTNVDERELARTQQGPGTTEFDDPLGLLLKCHERIELQLATLERAAAALRDGSKDDVRRALEPVDAAVGHFAVTGARHTEDEEESLFPRLRERGAAVEPSVRAALDVLEGEHRYVEDLHEELSRLVAAISREGDRVDSEVEQFCDCVSGLVDVYRPHIRLENEVVIPAAAALLAPDEIALVGREMRARRSVTRIGGGRNLR
jgi:hemerythrin-like domain-containing protein